MEIMEKTSMISKNDSVEYNWAMRTSMLKEDDDWKNRRAIPLKEQKRSFDIPTDESSILSLQREEDQTRIFASLVPDEVIYHITDYTRRNFDACLLFGDVSGFTDLCEKYNKTGKGGPSKLTQVLNSYIGAMVQEIISHDGDVFKFSGDAFIALWKVTDNLSMKDAVHEAIDCGLVIQKTYGRYQADQDVVIRVKLAISAGNLMFSLLGDMETSYYFVFGPPILDLKAAESQSFAGDIIITKTAWQHVSPNEYLAEELRDGMHAKIYGVGPNWRNIQRTTQYNKGEDQVSGMVQEVNQLSRTSLVADDDQMSEISQTSSVNLLAKGSEDALGAGESYNANSDQYALRPSVNFCLRMRMLKDLKKFIIAPVERGITADEPIEYLTEIRQVTILFINCKINISSEGKSAQVSDVANEAFKNVSRLVNEKYGCLNKLNMFDKDLLMLVIFGLRGLKHEMESQAALKCAKECYDSLGKIPNMLGVSCAVTTGKTYCGAFGHALRREYTVISLIVNKAARLMVAYPNKVTCDRETFLHSKLEARNFILQEYKPLKGIQNPGPVYEFKEVETVREVSLTVSLRPLLGREQEIDLYRHLYKLGKECSRKMEEEFFGMLVIQGESRQGKTRLLEELIFTTDPHTPICRFTLTKADLKVPYSSIRLLFNPLLGLDEKSSTSERERKILRRLKKISAQSEAHFFNSIFDLNFKTPPGYANMDNVVKYRQLKSLFKTFCKVVFTVFWVIAIDNSEFIDDESWVLISILTKQSLVFIVATMGLRSILSSVAVEVLTLPKIKIIQMKCIDKWYHVGLACQMLDVDAIPPELEKVIQSRSNGNPGWVESFLISVMQSGGLFIKTITRKLAYESGLVVPPLYMMVRLTQEEKDQWIQTMEEGEIQPSDTTYSKWKMYVDSCRESYPDLTIFPGLREKFNLQAQIKVCILNPSFNIDEVDPELSMDVLILKTFDSLTSYEQLLIKCSAILGDIFPRDMLMYIMSSSAVRLTALAVKKLFEIHVLCCARGNFIEGGLVFKERLKNPNEETEVTCECKGLIIDEACQDLPKYASCGYMRFLSTTFRETTYNLLTDNQKREFHAKAIRYLEKETRKCRACGNGYFTKYMGNKLDYDLRSQKLKKKKKKGEKARISVTTEQSSQITGMTNMRESDTMRFSLYSSGSGHSHESSSRYVKESATGHTFLSSMFSSHMSANLEVSSSTKNYDADIEGDFQMIQSAIGINTINKYKNDYNITKTFSDADFSQCTCLLILTAMYTQMIEHCSGAGLVEKMMNAMIEFCYVCIESQNVPQTFKILDEALDLLEGPMKQTVELDWMITLKRGKLYAIMGYSRMKLAQYEEGYVHLIAALDCYGITFPSNTVALSIKQISLSLQQDMSLYIFPKLYTGKSNDDDLSNYCNDVAECLYYLSSYFKIKGKFYHARLAAMWALKHAKYSETDFSLICMCYANMINMCTHFGDQGQNIALEVFAFELCQRKRSTVEREELKAVALMYSAIFFARVY
ncbi:adenylate cyclase type 10-like isoform X2 [Anthonomus grandis grandis]|uniref:adenylate cyclase type 10-like isoform X2 n=1 Tax=Anthonomus grandis grandis TaxID=2921223 RepID=UPI002164F6AF|nr:adenylate cyclase type 10-like isoform X2 [Anthonomus grandis grandis]